MFSPLKTYKSTFFLFVGFFIISSYSQAQEVTTYYRYFEIELRQSVDAGKDLKSNLFGEKPFQIHATCKLKNSVVISVPADYPKRVHQIEEEIKNSLKTVISEDKIESLHTIKALDLESFCQ